MSKYLFVLVAILIVGGMIFFLLDSGQNLGYDVNTNPVNTFEEDALGVDIESSEEISESEFTYNNPEPSVEQELPSDEFIQCLVDSGMVVYASRTCPACTQLANVFGGYDSVENLFVFCSEERERCTQEMQTSYVPEIQIEGELFEGGRTIENFSEKTDCTL